MVFSFQKDGPLDMRLGQKGKTAADVVNTCSEEELADILFYYGEEPRARQIAKAIIKKRTEAPLKTTLELASLVHSVLGKKSGKIDSATKTFQALRIYVNDELHVLEKGLQEAEEMLEIGGRLVVVTFHSLEDRIVKKFFNDRSGKNERPSSRHQPDSAPFKSPPTFSLITRRAQKPTDREIERNPRARSAKLRAGIRIGNENTKIFMSQEISQQGAST